VASISPWTELRRRYDELAMVASKWARYLAPIALLAVGTGTYLVIHSGLKPKPAITATQSQPQNQGSGRRHRRRSAKFYRVHGGDSLSGIAVKTGVPLATLEALNPRVPPNALQNGQRLRLRR
jgi:LysM repeat protein